MQPESDARDLLAVLPHLNDEERRELDKLLTAGMPVWVPQVGPQTVALESRADITFYGGAAGGGKTDLLIGAALTQHEKSIIFRREAVQLIGIEERVTKILGGRTGYNSKDNIWRLPGKPAGRTLELGSVKDPDDWNKYQGRPHDLIGFDEICHFLEAQVRALMGWKRTDNPNIRQRVIFAGNPPTDADGEWVIRFFAPWLDPMYGNPAKPGELRWFVTDQDGKDLEVPNGRPMKVGNEWMTPMSRTFIPSSVDDNLFLSISGYKATLQALPEPLRSQMLRGDFAAGRTDHVWQTIPTEWIKAAQARWVPRLDKGPMTGVGFDVARGGIDTSSIARRHSNWIDDLIKVPGVATPDGPTSAGLVIPLVRNAAPIFVDSIGIGSSVLDFLRGSQINVVGVVGSEGSTSFDKTGKLRFKNRRAEMYWRLREALDPTVEEPLSLPPDQELLADLCAVRYKAVAMAKEVGLLMRDKDEIREILGRSPDKGDSVAMLFIDGADLAFGNADQARAFRNRKRFN